MVYKTETINLRAKENRKFEAEVLIDNLANQRFQEGWELVTYTVIVAAHYSADMVYITFRKTN